MRNSNKFIQLSQVPEFKRISAQRRARQEGKLAIGLTRDQFRVQASNSFVHPLRPDARDGVDFYTQQFFESNGDLYVTCSCPFGQKGEDDDANVCKHIEAALVVRIKMPVVAPKPVFEHGTIVIDVQSGEFSVNADAFNNFGGNTPVTFKRTIRRGDGEQVYRNIINYLKGSASY